MKKVDEKWNNTWKEILENEDGTININQLKLELSDFSDMIDNMTTLVCHFSGESLSKPTYPAQVIIEHHNENVIKPLEEALGFYADMDCESWRHDNGDVAKKALGMINHIEE